MIEVLTGDLGALARTLAGLIADRVWPAAAASAGDLPGLLRRGRPLLLQGVASTLADRLGAALAERAEAAGDDRLLAALDSVRVGAVTDSAGTIHRRRRPGMTHREHGSGRALEHRRRRRPLGATTRTATTG